MIILEERKKVISSGLETAREVSALLTFSNEHASYTQHPEHRFFATGDTVHIKKYHFTMVKIRC